MPQDLDPALIVEKRRKSITDPLVWLYEVKVNDNDILRVARNNADVTWRSDTYYAYPISHSGVTAGVENEQDSGLSIQIQNHDKQLTSYIQANDGFRDRDVTMRLVSTLHDTLHFGEGLYVIQSCSITHEVINWGLGMRDAYRAEIPYRRFDRSYCSLEYGGPGCRFPKDRYTDAQLQALGISPDQFRRCDHTFDGVNGCEAHGAYALLLGIPVEWPARAGMQRSIPLARQ